jgi:hypothetical protein
LHIVPSPDKDRAAAFGILTPRAVDGLCPQYLVNRTMAMRSFCCLYGRLWPIAGTHEWPLYRRLSRAGLGRHYAFPRAMSSMR